MTLKIFGAGMAGLLAARMLLRHNPEVHELQEKLPDNHGALLRFRTDAVSEVTGIPFKRVHVQKAIYYKGKLLTEANLAHNNLYSMKVLGSVSGRSILNLAPAERFIAPDDFIACLADGVNITYGSKMEKAEECVSTIPLPALLKVLGLNVEETFEAKKIWTANGIINHPEVDLYQTIYFPDEDDGPLYRASITGRRVTLEYTKQPGGAHSDFTFMLKCFGLSDVLWTQSLEVKAQRFGKIIPINDQLRRDFISYATDVHRIYSVGRFATWRQIILDDVVKDLRFVDSLISRRDRYRFVQRTLERS